MLICIPGRREDGRDSVWFDTESDRRVREPRSLTRAKAKLRARARRAKAKAARS